MKKKKFNAALYKAEEIAGIKHYEPASNAGEEAENDKKEIDDRSEDELLAEALQAAENADYVIFFGGLNKSEGQDCEGSDRISLGLPYAQDRVIRELAKINKNLIFVNISGNAVADGFFDRLDLFAVR